MWSYQYLTRIDWRMIPVIMGLVICSLLVISSYSITVYAPLDVLDIPFLTPMVKTQLKWFLIGGVVFILMAGFDYNKLREWTWILYALTVLSLIGVFFTASIQGVHRWYRIPILNFSIQPSEHAKLIVVLALSWFLERRKSKSYSWSTAFFACIIVAIPFMLIVLEPDLDTALVLFPITVIMFYFGNVRPIIVKVLAGFAGIGLVVIGLIFLGVIPHEELRPYATKVIKNYQFDRLSPNTMHQRAATTAIAVGGVAGTGWRKSEYTAGGWLPAPYTDSVFPAFGEEFGLIGLIILLVLFYALIYFCFQVTAVAKDDFGRLLAAGVAGELSMHILANIGMMTGFLPVAGIPLLLVTYGGSSILSTMAALGILQSIYSRRFMF